MGRVVVVGDVGGHPDELRRALESVGAPGDELPPDVTVVQVGDLIDRGPDSAGVLRLVARRLDTAPDRWVQLAGNHEAQYLAGGSTFWRERLAPEDAEVLRSWWAAGRMNVAAAVRTVAGEDILITHAGLTVEAWRTLGEPMSAAGAASALNSRPGWLHNGFGYGDFAGPLWADAGSELYEAWMLAHGQGTFVPFDQAHGHSSIVDFETRAWTCPGRVRQRAAVDWAARHTRVRVGGRVFTGVDPKLGRHGGPEWRPLVLDGAEVLVGAATA